MNTLYPEHTGSVRIFPDIIDIHRFIRPYSQLIQGIEVYLSVRLHRPDFERHCHRVKKAEYATLFDLIFIIILLNVIEGD
jgi:hypothetical protein